MRQQPHTLDIFPSQPTQMVSKPCDSQRSSQPSMESSNPRNEAASAQLLKRERNSKGPNFGSQFQARPKIADPKILRRLAQNREAARKSRLRKKAYVQQLESSRMRLSQIEQEIQIARAQGFYLGGTGDEGLPSIMNVNSEAAAFHVEYGRWMDEQHRLTEELRRAVRDGLPDNELRIYVDNYMDHYDQIIPLKSIIARSDVFHLISGAWRTPAERLFLWIGGSRPSELIKIIMSQIEPVTEQQLIGIYALQQSTSEAEEALSNGLAAVANSLSETLISQSLAIPQNVNHYMAQMALAINKLATFEGFVRQADNLRHQTVHRLREILTTRQAAQCFLAIAEYFHRLRALSSIWMARPRQE